MKAQIVIEWNEDNNKKLLPENETLLTLIALGHVRKQLAEEYKEGEVYAIIKVKGKDVTFFGWWRVAFESK